MRLLNVALLTAGSLAFPHWGEAVSFGSGGAAGVAAAGAASAGVAGGAVGQGIGQIGGSMAQFGAGMSAVPGAVQGCIQECPKDPMTGQPVPPCPAQCEAKGQGFMSKLQQAMQAAMKVKDALKKEGEKAEKNQQDNKAQQAKSEDSAKGAKELSKAAGTVVSHGQTKSGTEPGESASKISLADPNSNLFAPLEGSTNEDRALVGGSETSLDSLGGVGWNSNVDGSHSGGGSVANGVKSAGGGSGTTAGYGDDAAAFASTVGSESAPLDYGALLGGMTGDASSSSASSANSFGDFSAGGSSGPGSVFASFAQAFGADPSIMTQIAKDKPVPMEMVGFRAKNMLEVENQRTGRLLNMMGRVHLAYQYADPRGVPLPNGRGAMMHYFYLRKSVDKDGAVIPRALASSGAAAALPQ